MLYAKWGYFEMNPPGLNDWKVGNEAHYAFSSSGCGDLIRLPQALEYPALCRNVRYIGVNDIWNELAAGHPVIVRTTTCGSHFMVIFGHDGTRYWVKDPLKTGNGECVLYGYAHSDGPYRVYGY